VIALLDYGAGNLTSVRKGFKASGADVVTPSTPSDLSRARGIVIPGVGHFAATAAIGEEWRRAVLNAVDRRVPLLGICLGMQYLFEASDEAPGAPGLALLAGRCSLLPPDQKIPHVGWNELKVTRASRLLDGIGDGAQVYFTHSYAAPVTSACVASTEYTAPFAAVVEKDNVFGVQFHPEKSSEAGLRLLRNFVSFVSSC
jgi:imidazole glycerol-phosphate synthase subunit HisH